MGLFHRFARHHGHHHSHHHCDRDGRDAGAGSHAEHVAERISGRLDLNDEQHDKLAVLLEEVWAQRAAIKSPDLVEQLGGLIQGERLDRDAARAWVDQRIAAVQAGSGPVLAALGDFYDSLDAEQQQVLRFMLRMRGREGGRWGRGRGGRRSAQ